LLGASSLILGQFDAARDHLDRALALYAPEQHRPLTGQFVHDIGAMVLANRSWVLWLLGYPAMAQSDIEALLRNARDLGQAATLMFALFHVAIPEILFGKFAAAEAHAQELITIAEEKGAMLWRAFGVLFHGWTLSLASGDPEAAEIISTGFGDWEVTGARLFRPIFLSALARAQTALGQFDRASNCMSQALGLVGATNERWAEAEIHRTAGELMLASGDPPKKAEAHFRRSLTVARKQKAKSWELKTATSLARLWRDQGRPDEARELVAPIYGCFTEGFDTADLQAAEALLAQLDAR
jgi:predicted ATPase